MLILRDELVDCDDGGDYYVGEIHLSIRCEHKERIMFKLRLIAISMCFVAIQVIADPFMGEGKQGYINRCATDFSGQGVDVQFARAFCSCTADKMEKEYPALVQSLNPNDAPAINQNKMNQHGQRIMQQCLDLAK